MQFLFNNRIITSSLFDIRIIVFIRHSKPVRHSSPAFVATTSRIPVLDIAVPLNLSSLLGSIFRSWINPARRLCRQKSDSRLVGVLAKRRLRIRNCFRLAKVPCIELANPCRLLNGCQSFPVLGLVARRKVSELVRKGMKRPGLWQDLPDRYEGDNNVNLGMNVGFVSCLQATRTRAQEMIFRAEKDRFFHAFLNQLEWSALIRY